MLSLDPKRIKLRHILRECFKAPLGPLLRWPPLADPSPGYSVILGTPWDLRHLLQANLRFVARADLTRLSRLCVVFDRTRRTGADEFIAATKGAFPMLPLEFRFHPWLAGKIARAANTSKFYACLNWVTGLKACRTQYAILHDFDLYPLVPNFFEDIFAAMENRGLFFSGPEYTDLAGLTDEDGLIGTWELGIDVQYLRQHCRPIECFHTNAAVGGRRLDLDGFSLVQSRTHKRGLTPTVGPRSYVHVKNLCATYQRISKGERIRVAWRLHYLWYLESLCGRAEKLPVVINAMRRAQSGRLLVEGYDVDFSREHVTCGNVLQGDVQRMESFLFGGCRPEVREYLEAFQEFLKKHGDAQPLHVNMEDA